MKIKTFNLNSSMSPDRMQNMINSQINSFLIENEVVDMKLTGFSDNASILTLIYKNKKPSRKTEFRLFQLRPNLLSAKTEQVKREEIERFIETEDIQHFEVSTLGNENVAFVAIYKERKSKGE